MARLFCSAPCSPKPHRGKGGGGGGGGEEAKFKKVVDLCQFPLLNEDSKKKS